MSVTELSSNWTHRLDMTITLQQSFLAYALRRESNAEAITVDYEWACGGSSRIFRGTADQIRRVRIFVQSQLGDHLAVDNAVLVASELSTNAIEHSKSGSGKGLFIVHLAELSATQVSIIVTDEGGPGKPMAQSADSDAERGRGLAVVRSVSTLLMTIGTLGLPPSDLLPQLAGTGLACSPAPGRMRSVLAVVQADESAGGFEMRWNPQIAEAPDDH